MMSEKYTFNVTEMHENFLGGLDGFHEAVDNKHGDWRIDGKPHYIPVKYILNYLIDNPRDPVKVPLKRIAFKGLENLNNENWTPSSRVIDADMTYPVIVAKDVSNPYERQYRMVDGAHRATKSILNNDSHIDSYILTKEEFLQLIEEYENTRWDEDEHIELLEIRDFFGFPACIYKFKKHEQLKTKLLEELVEKDQSDTYRNRTYVRTRPDGEPLFQCDEGSALHEVKIAKQKAYNHFYNEIISADFTLDCEENNYNPKLQTTKYSRPKITQSWVVAVPPNETNKFISNPMTTHVHYMSPVCGAYYANIDNDDPIRDGGNLIFSNPAFKRYDVGSLTYMLSDCLRATGYIKYQERCILREGYIVLWSGVLFHTIEPFRNTPTDRISIITNSCPDPLFDTVRKYNYNVTPYFPSTEEDS